MSAAQTSSLPAEWYLARDGQQFGPLSDVELRKLVEFGHLKPTDLLWREGFPDWRPARILLPDGPPAAPPAPRVVEPPPAAAPVRAPAAVAPAQPAAPVAQPATPTLDPVQAAPAIAAPATPVAAPPDRAVQATPPVPAPARVPQPAPRPGPQPQAAAAAAPGPAPHAATPQAVARPPTQPSGPSLQIPQGHASARVAQPGPKSRRGAAPLDRGRAAGRERPPRSGLWLKRLGILIFFAITLSAAGWLAYPFRDRIVSWVTSVGAMVPNTPVASPLGGYAPTTEATDAAFQQSPLWRLLKREFPDWYDARVKEASAAARDQKPAADISRQLMQATLELRRKHAGDALSATSSKLLSVASSFADALVRLRQTSVDACYSYIVSGEVSPGYIEALTDPARTRAIQAQLTAVFEAIAEGRKLPRIYPQPKQADYNQLVSVLESKGWSEKDMALFSNGQAFGQAPPAQVCKMVTEWFQAQLELKDADAQLRLLADSLRPVVAG